MKCSVVVSKLKHSRNSTPYYANTTACFNIILAGDIEVNPGPESSGPSIPTEKPTGDTCLQVYLQNVRSLKNKLDVLHSSLVAHLQPGGMFNFFALTETWLTDAVLDAEINIPNYTVFRNDRSNRRGGGVLLGCHNAFECRRRSDLEHDDLELLWVEVRLSNRSKMLFGVFYRPPDSGVQPLENLADTLTNASRHFNTIYIAGDFNLPSLQWDSDSGLAVSSGSTIEDVFVDAVMAAHSLQQVNFSPTRGDNILDLVLCSALQQVSCETGDDIFASDHNSVRISIQVTAKTKPYDASRPIFNYRKADLYDLQRTIECIPWCLLEATDDCDEATSLFYDFIEAAVIDVVPVVRPRRPSPPWFDGEVRHALKAKERTFRRKKKSPTPANLELFKEARSNFKQIVRGKYANYLSSVAADIGKNPKRFWSFIKTRSCSRQHALPSVLRNETSGFEAADSAGKADLLKDCFQSVYVPASSDESDATMPVLQSSNLDAMPAISITKSDVISKLSDIDVSKAIGPDNLSGFVLKSCANVSKVFEKILSEHIMCHVQPAISEQQHGFISGRDCSTNLTS
ncbi:uncharacterized protein LOC119720442 [Patiria miniata]|uniref:Endonuclease/exonuclease/phosphatase domain-containing protein n=1 Tax=Patiria miniata TaxID=46514 RepID=A0A913Z2H5_PATMI|nr:uncharacterized protein LOC119720442 [Patiria miniata]